MPTEIQSMETLSSDLTELILPWVAVLMSAIIAFMLKDFVSSFSKGIKFKFNPQFREGDKVILDGERALIVKIGMTETVFGVTKSSGEFDGDYVWRYVPNERISFLKLEKVIFDITSINNEKKIGNNKEEIDKIKKRDSK
jgi:small-conductance mechanosensitive channel